MRASVWWKNFVHTKSNINNCNCIFIVELLLYIRRICFVYLHLHTPLASSFHLLSSYHRSVEPCSRKVRLNGVVKWLGGGMGKWGDRASYKRGRRSGITQNIIVILHSLLVLALAVTFHRRCALSSLLFSLNLFFQSQSQFVQPLRFRSTANVRFLCVYRLHSFACFLWKFARRIFYSAENWELRMRRTMELFVRLFVQKKIASDQCGWMNELIVPCCRYQFNDRWICSFVSDHWKAHKFLIKILGFDGIFPKLIFFILLFLGALKRKIFLCFLWF